ncbi:hypothetical protein AB6A40_006341 [Gnathostoma spinigerum]|uniref:Uncharacterized protein n=1 Tax=Gnathostoma spinigerum TaxID=75299 RepID=A0ABD6EKB3_9BILA
MEVNVSNTNRSNDIFSMIGVHSFGGTFRNSLLDVVNETESFVCPPYLQTFESIFGDCPDTPLKWLGFAIGLLSLVFWTIVVIPQIVENYQLKSSHGISVYFLLIWLLSDVFNTVGAFLTYQLAVQKATGILFFFEDVILLSQHAYYKRIYPRYHPEKQVSIATSRTTISFTLLALISTSLITMHFYPLMETGDNIAFKSRHILSETTTVTNPTSNDSTTSVIGFIMGSISATIMIIARWPQLYRNFRRKTCHGVSKAFFIFMVLGNITFAISIFFQSTGWYFLLTHLPWLLGALIGIIEDIAVLLQCLYYDNDGFPVQFRHRSGIYECN